MLNIKKIYMIVTLWALLIIQLLPMQVLAVESSQRNNGILTSSEIDMLNEYSSSLANNSLIIELKKANLLDEFADFLEEKVEIQITKDEKSMLEQLKVWGIEPSHTVKDIGIMAQEYLNKHMYNIKINSNEFHELVAEYFNNNYPMYEIAEKDSEFGALYVYMCIYYDNFCSESGYMPSSHILKTSSLNQNQKRFTEKVECSDIREIVADDVERNVKATYTNLYVKEYAQRAAVDGNDPVWPNLNGNAIQSYARTYANESDDDYHNSYYIYIDGGDCTNFVSQALFNGYLPMTYYVSDQNGNGYTDTSERWFYFNNSSTTGYSISTCWVRVVELYDYLSPHYACGENDASTAMSPYLNKGFVLQGKPFIGKYKHSVIVTITNGQLTYCGHSSQRVDEPIATFYDSFYKCRVIQVY